MRGASSSLLGPFCILMHPGTRTTTRFTTVQKRLAHGFSILANYTWEKSIDTVPPSSGGTGASVAGGGSNAPLPWYLPGNRQLDYGLSDFNRQHVFVVSYLWDIPKPST